jgi:GAF domain-containing protein
VSDASFKDTRLAELVELAALVTSSLDPVDIRRRAVEASTRLVDAERASLLLLEKHRGSLYFEVALGENADVLKRVRIVPGEGIAGNVLTSCTAEIVNDVASDPRHLAQADTSTGFETRSMLCIPLSCRDEPLGVLEVINKRSGEFDDEDLALATALANQIAVAIQNARLYERLRRSALETWIYSALLSAIFITLGAWIISAVR